MRSSLSLLAGLLAVTATFHSVNGSDYFGQAPTYGAGYAPEGYAPVPASNYNPGATYVSGYAPATPTTFGPNATTSLSSNGAYQAQRPGYFDNPSVYTGTPTYSGVAASGYQPSYQSFNASMADRYRGNAAPVGYAESYSSFYDGSSPGQPIPLATQTGTPLTAIPVTPVAPIYAPAPQTGGCCLSRFCSKLFGTNYSTSYYRAPVTFYRPVTVTNPVSGTPVIVQQPCTSFEQQVQRTPYNSLQFGSPSPPPTSCPTGCPTGQPGCSPTPYGYGAANTGTPNGTGQFGSVGQVGAMGGTGGVTQIPSTSPTIAPPAGMPNMAPLTGSPTIAPPSGTNDLAPVGQPRLESGAVPSIPQAESDPPSVQSTPPQWQLQSPQDSTALIRPRNAEPNDFSAPLALKPTRHSLRHNESSTTRTSLARNRSRRQPTTLLRMARMHFNPLAPRP